MASGGGGGDDEESTTTKDSIREGVGDFKKVFGHWVMEVPLSMFSIVGMIGMSDTSWLVFKSFHGTPRDADSLLTPSFSSQHLAICFESS